MPSRPYSFFIFGLLIVLAGAAFVIVYPRVQESTITYTANAIPQTAAVVTPFSGIGATNDYYTITLPTTNTATASLSAKPVKTILNNAKNPTTSTSSVSAPSNEVTRIENLYGTEPPESFDTVNTSARAALVNILCMPRAGGSLSPISGSGVIIDPRGVILTNAHVAQYVLLSESPDINLSCQIRTGNPAIPQWTASVLYMPAVWVSAHAAEINTQHPTGTGEHDYALLLINGALNGAALPSTFPYLPYDTRDGIGFLNDQVLGASYPAEFAGGLAAENDLFPVSSISSIDQLLTLGTDTVDVISIGGVVEAQSGSSGGPVVNQWGKLIGIITTTSDAPTTAQRDLRAITMSYIDRDFTAQTGVDLTTFLSSNVADEAARFTSNIAPGLIQDYISLLSK